MYLSQAKSGVVAEALATKKRTVFGMTAKVTALSDIAIYTDEEELPLREVFNAMKAKLGEDKAPDAKSDSKVLVKFFEEAIPNYDRDRFYVSHMKKVVQWYNILKEYASLDFVAPQTEEEDESAE